jgi:hypothetical protein
MSLALAGYLWLWELVSDIFHTAEWSFSSVSSLGSLSLVKLKCYFMCMMVYILVYIKGTESVQGMIKC